MSKRRMKTAYRAAETYRAYFEREFEKRFVKILRGGFWKRLAWWIFPALRRKAMNAADGKWQQARREYVERSLKKLARRAAGITRDHAKGGRNGRVKVV